MKVAKRRPTYHLTMLALCSMLAPAAAGKLSSLSSQGIASGWQCTAGLHGDWQCTTPSHGASLHTLEAVTQKQLRLPQAASADLTPKADLMSKLSEWQCLAQQDDDWNCRKNPDTAYKHSLENVVSKKRLHESSIVSDRPSSIKKEEIIAKNTISELEILQQEIEVLSEALSLLREKDYVEQPSTVKLPESQKQIHSQLSKAAQPAKKSGKPAIKTPIVAKEIIPPSNSSEPPSNSSEQKALGTSTEILTASLEAQFNSLESSLADTSVSFPRTAALPEEPASTKAVTAIQEPLKTPKERLETAKALSDDTKEESVFEHLLNKTLINEGLKLTIEKPEVTTTALRDYHPVQPEITPGNKAAPSHNRKSRQSIARLLMAEQMNSEPPFSTATIDSIKRENRPHQLRPADTQRSYTQAAPVQHYAQPPTPYQYQAPHHSVKTQRDILAASPYYQAQPEHIEVPEYVPPQPSHSYRPSTEIHKIRQTSPPGPEYASYRKHLAPMIEESRQQIEEMPYHQSPAISAKDMLDHMQTSADDYSSTIFYPGYTFQKPVSESSTQPSTQNSPVNSAQRLQMKAQEFESNLKRVEEAHRPPASSQTNERKHNISRPIYKDALNTPPRTAIPGTLYAGTASHSTPLLNAPSHHFTMQWGASTNKAELEQLKRYYPELIQAMVLPSTLNGRPYYLLINGTYQDMYNALSSLRSLQWSRLAKVLNPWARTIRSLKTQPSPSKQQVQTLPQGGYTIQWAESPSLHDIKQLKQSYPQLVHAKMLRLSRPQQVTQYILIEGSYPNRLTAMDTLTQPGLMHLTQQLQPKARPMASLKSAAPLSPESIMSEAIIPGSVFNQRSATKNHFPNTYQSPISGYTIQWLASDNPTMITDIQQRYPVLHSAVIVSENNKYILLQGSFIQASEARKALSQSDLQQATQALSPWVRPVASLNLPHNM